MARWGEADPAGPNCQVVDVSLEVSVTALWRAGAQGPTASLRMTGYNFTFSTNFTTLGQQGNAEYYFAGNLTASVRPRAARRRTPAACLDACAPCASRSQRLLVRRTFARTRRPAGAPAPLCCAGRGCPAACGAGHSAERNVCVAQATLGCPANCGLHGRCRQASGAAACACDCGWAGAPQRLPPAPAAR